jgi:hypothetical protein
MRQLDEGMDVPGIASAQRIPEHRPYLALDLLKPIAPRITLIPGMQRNPLRRDVLPLRAQP